MAKASAGPQGIERNVLTMWNWGDNVAFVHDEIATDKRNPRVNANGRSNGVDIGNGRIDDPDAGWKGRGVYATYGADAAWHVEGGPEEPGEPGEVPDPAGPAGALRTAGAILGLHRPSGMRAGRARVTAHASYSRNPAPVKSLSNANASSIPRWRMTRKLT